MDATAMVSPARFVTSLSPIVTIYINILPPRATCQELADDAEAAGVRGDLALLLQGDPRHGLRDRHHGGQLPPHQEARTCECELDIEASIK